MFLESGTQEQILHDICVHDTARKNSEENLLGDALKLTV